MVSGCDAYASRDRPRLRSAVVARRRSCMRILFDQGTPVPLRRQLPGHTIDTVYEQDWATLSNGRLLTVAEEAGYDLIITTDQNLRYQQNLGGRSLAILVLGSTSWPRLRGHVDTIQAAVDTSTPGAYQELSF